MSGRYRRESDIIGSVDVPADAYYGSFSVRARDNFRISGDLVRRDFISGYAVVKRAAAAANLRCGKLDKARARRIIEACDEVVAGGLYDQFIVDVFQAGAGTSTNMNLNEVLANRALELMGKRKGDYKALNPNDHVNASQSTNDTFHVAIHVSCYAALDGLLESLKSLESALAAKGREFSGIVKVGRTHLQDAVPMTLGEEFAGYSGEVAACSRRIAEAREELLEVPFGGTALGTGINAPKGFPEAAVAELSRLTRARFFVPKDMFHAMQDQAVEAHLAGALKNAALTLNKIANDTRLLSSGPRAGIGEIELPEVQPGSSIMPGKVNPSMAEMLNMVCFEVMGRETAICEAAGAGQMELNVFMPLIAHDLLYSIGILSNGVRAFAERCVKGIKADRKRISGYLSDSLQIVTALSPAIGYAKAAEVARKAYLKDKSIREIAVGEGYVSADEFDRLVNPSKLAGL